MQNIAHLLIFCYNNPAYDVFSGVFVTFYALDMQMRLVGWELNRGVFLLNQ